MAFTHAPLPASDIHAVAPCKLNKLQERHIVQERRKLREEQKLTEKQAAGKLSVTVLAWHTQAASNFQNAKFVWEQFSLPAAFKPETQQDPAHSDSAHTEATHTEAFHKKPVHVCPAEGPFKTDGSSTDVAPLLLQNNPEADGKSEATAAVPQKQRGRPKRSRNKHSTVSNAGTGASAGTTTGATGLAFRAASHTGCKQPPNRPVRPLP